MTQSNPKKGLIEKKTCHIECSMTMRTLYMFSTPKKIRQLST